MTDLFDQLKSAGPIKKSNSAAKYVSSCKSSFSNNLKQFNEMLQNNTSGVRRESLPSPDTVSNASKKFKSNKSRSLSPPKYVVNNVIKSLKVKLERKKLEEFLTRPLEEHANNIRKKQDKIKNISKHPKLTLTKAQQKLFEPIVDQEKSKAQVLKHFNLKQCKVLIRRDNFQKLSKEYKNKIGSKNYVKVKKRPSLSSSTDSPPLKKNKISVENKNNKNKSSFFIKLNTSPNSKLEKKFKNISRGSLSSEAHHNKIKNSKFDTITAPTKFSRSQLLRSFGKRFFNVQVKIERCTHPLMLTFESNDRARRLQAKRNKSKNLSVSFREQVEIFGDSTDSDDSCDENFCPVPINRSRKNNINHTPSITGTPVVMPARLKKVENGKVVDDIELDPSLFVDPKVLISSTPFLPGRKKRDHKSFSPLKDESSPSPRKEQLKLANERIPPTGLRRLNTEEDDDEDDDCEYIVPIEMPQRRTSRTSSNATIDDLSSACLPLADSPVNFHGIFDDYSTDKTNFNTNINDAGKYPADNTKSENSEKQISLVYQEDGSNDSFQSAKDNIEDNSGFNADNINFSSVRLVDQEPIKSNKDEPLQQNNGNPCNETSGNHLSALNTVDDMSINLFLEDSQTNEDDTHAKSFVDSLINETIDKLSREIDDDTTDKHYSKTT